MRTLIVVLAVLCFLPVFASEPGQPLDCSDWVFLEPGYSCQTLLPAPCTQASNIFCTYNHSGLTADNEGRPDFVLPAGDAGSG